MQCILKDVTTNVNVENVIRSLYKWVVVIGKVLVVAVLWLGLPPMLVGFYINAFFIVPLRTPLNETPQYSFGQIWIVGLILLKIWMRCVLSGVFGDIPLRAHLEQIIIRGFTQFDAWSAIQRVVLPVLTVLMDHTLVPYFLSRLLCLGLNSYLLRTCAVRYALHGYMAMKIGVYSGIYVYTLITAFHREVRDSRYLVGTKLVNRKVI